MNPNTMKFLEQDEGGTVHSAEVVDAITDELIRAIEERKGNNRTPEKPLVGQKKSMEVPGSSPLPSSKKRKVSKAFADQSIGHLNDVTAVSGVNLKDEEEQLFSGSKAISERIVQEEERLIFDKILIHKKVIEIMAKCGLKSMSNDVEQCLSVCLEERMRGLVTNLIRLSKKRVDIEKPSHRTIITSDLRQQIMSINRKARQECAIEQAETEDAQKLNETDRISGVDDDKEKSESHVRDVNMAVRAATGVDDMLSKWQSMIEAKQKPEKNNTSRKFQEAERRGRFNTPALRREVGRNEMVVPRSITVKDVIGILEKEPQTLKSTLSCHSYFEDQCC